MIQPILCFSVLFVLFCLITFCKPTQDTQGTGILYTGDKHICRNLTWKLESRFVYVNATTVVRKGDGTLVNVTNRMLLPGVVNVTTTTEICCPGYFRHTKGKCKECPKGRYGLDCLNVCDCTGFKQCDRRTGECKKCIEEPCADDDGGDDDDKFTVSTKDFITTPRPQSTGKSAATSTVIGATERDHGIDYIIYITTAHPCDICEQYGNCSKESGCALISTGHDSDSSHKTDKWTIISIVLSISVVGNVIAFVLGFTRFQRRRQRNLSQTTPVIQLTNDVNNGGGNSLTESSHEYLQMTDGCHSYNALDNNRAYVSMYNELKNIDQYTEAFTPNGNNRQHMHSEMEIETDRHSVGKDYEPVE